MVDIDIVIFGIIVITIILIAVTDSRCCNHNNRRNPAAATLWIQNDIETGQAPPFGHPQNQQDEDGSTVGGTVKYKCPEAAAAAEDNDEEKDCCSICLVEFKEDEACRRLEKCHHLFHKECIDEWFHKNFICPICRGSVHKVKPAAAAAAAEPEPILD